MSDPVIPIQNAEPQAANIAQQASPANQASANANSGNVAVSTMQELELKEPKFYKLLIDSMMTLIIGQIQHHEQNMKQIEQDNERNNKNA